MLVVTVVSVTCHGCDGCDCNDTMYRSAKEVFDSRSRQVNASSCSLFCVSCRNQCISVNLWIGLSSCWHVNMSGT